MGESSDSDISSLQNMRESKLVVLGAGGVGKSSLVLQHLQGRFSNSYKPTVEDCYNHTLQLPNGLFHALEILDTAGSHNFPAMRELSIKCGRGFILVFAVNNEQSFYEAQNLWSLIREIKDVENVPVIVVGNKIDITEREVTWQMAHDFVATNIPNGSYIETSAKYNLYVNDVFNELLILTFGAPSQRKPSRPSRLSLSFSEMSISSFRRKSSSTTTSASSANFNTASSHCPSENSSIFGLPRIGSSFCGSNPLQLTPENKIYNDVLHENDLNRVKLCRSHGNAFVRVSNSYQCRQKLKKGTGTYRPQKDDKCVLL